MILLNWCQKSLETGPVNESGKRQPGQGTGAWGSGMLARRSGWFAFPDGGGNVDGVHPNAVSFCLAVHFASS